MRTATARRTTLAVVVALGFGGVSASLLPTASVARPIGETAPAKDCRINGGNTIRSGSTGRTDGIEYACTDGVACQVEGGRTTRKCSHASRQIILGGVGTSRVQVLSRAR